MSLRDIRVLDASDSIAGQFAGRIFADHGAHVVLCESPIGSTTRSLPPRTQVGSVQRSLLFEHLNGGKESIVLDLEDECGRQHFDELARLADVVIVSDPRVVEMVESSGSGATLGVVDNFSPGGCYSSWSGSELVHQALSGSMHYTGLADRPPLHGVGHRASYAAGVQLLIGLAAALTESLSTGRSGRRVDVSVHEAAAAMEQNFSTQYSYNGSYPERGEKLRPRGHARCADGWLVYFVRGGQWVDFCDVFGAPELARDPRFAEWTDLVQNWPEAEQALQAYASTLSTSEVFERARQRQLVLAPMLTLQQLWNEPHLRQRQYWQEVPGPVPIALGPMFRFSSEPANRCRPAPELGTVTNFAARSHPERRVAAQPKRVRPLSGIRVLDLTAAWAGPMATRLLAALGADIVKIEGPARPDPWRGEVYDPPGSYPYPNLEPGERPYDRHAWFNSQNQDKRSVALDLKSSEGLALAHQLIEAVDVVIANWSPGALDRAGLGYDEVSKINPGVVVVEMPAISAAGQLSDIRGLGPTMEAMSGIGQLIGYPPDRPLGSGSAYLDPTGALHGAAAVALGLLRRELSGCGGAIEVPQREAAMHWIGELVLDAVVNGSDPGPSGYEARDAAPYGAYPANGHDEWIAIEITSDAHWRVFCEVVEPSLLADGRFAIHSDRVAFRDELDRAVAAAVARCHKLPLADLLQRSGIRAAPVQNGRDLFFDPHLRSVGWFTSLEHPTAGVHEYPGLPLRFDGARCRPERAAPRYGEHTEEVLAELLDVDADGFCRLLECGVVVDRPRGRGGM